MYLSQNPDDPLRLIERAMTAALAAQAAEVKIRTATREGRLPSATPPDAGMETVVERARTAGIITAEEAQSMIEAQALMDRVIRVDDFAADLGISLFQGPHADHEAASAAPSPAAPRRRAAA